MPVSRSSARSDRSLPPTTQEFPVLEGTNKTGEQNARICFGCTFDSRCVGEVRAQDAAAGEKVFGVCKACHQIGETAKNSVGPVLNGLIGRKAGSVPGYSYLSANRSPASPGMRPPSANTSRTRKRKSRHQDDLCRPQG